MRFTIPLLAVIAGLLLPQSAAAADVITPKLTGIEVKCQFKEGANHTIEIMMDKVYVRWDAFDIVDYTFKNTVSQQNLTFKKRPSEWLLSFPLPEGTYDLTISFAKLGGAHRLHDRAQVLYKRISVPPIVSTNGKGSGCAFA